MTFEVGRELADVSQRAWQDHAAELVRYATLLVGPTDAADVGSVAFMRCAHRLGDVDNVPAYLYRAVSTSAFDERRSVQRRHRRDLHAVLPAVTSPPTSDVDVRQAVAGLSVQQRAAVYFTYWHDYTAEQVGDLLGIGPATVRRHLARARSHLRKALR